MRNLCATVLATALLVLPAGQAAAHEGNPDYRSVIDQIDPAIDGLTVEVVNFDDSLKLVNHSGKDVTVDGYEGEPYGRVLADGTVELNRSSPAYYLNDDRFADVDVPAGVDADDPPDWERVDGSSTLTWHDHRMHWMSTSLPPQVTDESKETKILDYEIPLQVGDQSGAIEGTLSWVGRDDSGIPVLPVVVAALALVFGSVGLVARNRRLVRESEGGKHERSDW